MKEDLKNVDKNQTFIAFLSLKIFFFLKIKMYLF